MGARRTTAYRNAGLRALRTASRRDPRRTRHGSRHAGHPRHAAPVPAGARRLDGRLRRRREAPHRVPGGAARAASPVRTARSIEGPISFFSLCEHHALPFHGVAHVAYIAAGEILGISKLTRLVRLYARRFTVQERLGEQIADGLVELVAPQRRRGPSRCVASLHADARRQRGELSHEHDVLARRVRRRRRSAARVPRRGARAPQTVTLEPLQLLDERPGLPTLDLPDELERLYGGGLGVRRADPSSPTSSRRSTVSSRCLTVERSNAIVSDESEADRFVMGLLRAFADVVVVGSGTLLASPKGTWRAGRRLSTGGRRVRGAAAPPRQEPASRRSQSSRRAARSTRRIRCSRPGRVVLTTAARRGRPAGGRAVRRPRSWR